MSITTNSEKGERIFEYLKAELGLPEETISFTLKMGVDEFIEVEVKYFVQEDKK